MDKKSRIFIAGHRGLVGSAIYRKLRSEGYGTIITRSRGNLDLERQCEVESFFEAERPEYVFLAAAKVGGIHANNTYPANFIYENMMIESNIVHSAWKSGTKKLLFLGSSCIYPRDCPQPIKEEYLLSGPLEPSNEAYAVAKIAGIKMCQAYNRQYGADFISVMPTNLYGPHDNFDPNTSHVLPALIRKIHEAKMKYSPTVTIWGTGRPMREFLHVDDLANACLFLMKNYSSSEIINVGVGEDLSIGQLARRIADIVGFAGDILFDPTKLDGTPRKLLDVSKLYRLGWRPGIGLEKGIKETYNYFLQNVWEEKPMDGFIPFEAMSRTQPQTLNA